MSSFRGRAFVTLATALAATAVARAEVRLPALVGSHMVLQRDAPARVWGWADPGEVVRVRVPEPLAVRYAWADNPEATLRNGAGLPASPFRTDDWPMLTAPLRPADGRELVRAMHARYAGRWYRDLMLVQDVARYREGREESRERIAEYISLPGRVRAITGPIEDGNAEIYTGGAFHIYEGGRLTRQVDAVHAVLVLGFDVYVQDPGRTIAQLEALGVELGRIREAEWKGRPAWVVGAPEGDDASPQFWVEKDRLLCTRVVSKRPAAVLDVEMGRFEPLGEGWVAAELLFKRNGQLAIREDYVTFGLVDRMDPSLFDTRTLKASGPLPEAAAGRITSFRNPVIPGFHPDPSVVRVGSDFHLVTSSFEFFPGVPIFTSRDLVHWKPLGHVLTRESQVPLQKARPSGGIYAPTLRYHDGTYYMITTNVDGGGNFFVTAKEPAGPWSDPVWLRDFGGIDPSLFFDADGTVYLTGQGSGGPGQPRGIYQTTLDVRTGTLREPLRLVWDRTGTRYPEAPHLYKIRGRYYLMIAEGGTEYGHMVKVARSDSPWGPFEACPRNPILTNRQTENDAPVQGTGHADLVEAPDGSWWMVFLAFRPVSGSWHHLGRETFLAPVTWDADGWPVVNDGNPVGLEVKAAGLPAHAVPSSPTRTGFDAPLGPEWNYLRHPRREAYALDARPGWLTLRGDASPLSAAASPTWVGRRQQHLSGRVATLVDFVPGRDGEEAGISVYMNPDHRYEIGVGRGNGRRQVFVRQRVGPYLETVTASAPLDGTEPVVLQIDSTPEEYSFSYGVAMSGKPAVARNPLGRAAARYLSSEVAGGFTGVYFGLYATGNGREASAPAHFDWFDVEPSRN